MDQDLKPDEDTIPDAPPVDYDEEKDAKEPAPNALMSMWGSGDVERDRARRATAKSMISPPEGGARPQDIRTPQNFLNCVAELWPEGIGLDPCANVEGLVKAAEYYHLDKGQDGLVLPWKEFTFVNPPYKTLEDWLAKFREEVIQRGIKEILMLIPVRTHRAWFRRTRRTACTEIVELDPLCFCGFKQSFPAPLCVFYSGQRVAEIAKAFRPLSRE